MTRNESQTGKSISFCSPHPKCQTRCCSGTIKQVQSQRNNSSGVVKDGDVSRAFDTRLLFVGLSTLRVGIAPKSYAVKLSNMNYISEGALCSRRGQIHYNPPPNISIRTNKPQPEEDIQRKEIKTEESVQIKKEMSLRMHLG